MESPSSTPRSLADLQPKMRLEGTVAKLEMFGAFVDVGLGQPGLVHISMLSRARVNRVEDVVREGQAVEVWVQRVDPGRNRLELTMIPPVQVEWKDLAPGKRLRGKVVRLEKFGAFVDIGADRPGLVHVSEMSREYVRDPAEVVKVGAEIDVAVIEVDRTKRQIRLSMKAADEEPAAPVEEEAEPPVPTAMELALRQAMGEAEPHNPAAADAPAAPRRGRRREAQEDILKRTLKTRADTTTPER